MVMWVRDRVQALWLGWSGLGLGFRVRWVRVSVQGLWLGGLGLGCRVRWVRVRFRVRLVRGRVQG